MGQVCALGLAPSLIEAAEQPVPLVLRIMELREYARVKGIVEDPETEEADWPDTPMVDAVLASRQRQMDERG